MRSGGFVFLVNPMTDREIREMRPQLVAAAHRCGVTRREDAEDIAEEAILKTVLAIRGGKDIPRPITYARVVMRRLCADHLRATSTRCERLQTDLMDGWFEDVLVHDEAEVLANELDSQVVSALAALSDAQRRTIIAIDVAQTPREEFAAAERISMGALRTRISDARARMRQLLAAPAPHAYLK